MATESKGTLKFDASVNKTCGLVGNWEGLIDGKCVVMADLSFCFKTVQKATGKRPMPHDDISRKQWNREYFATVGRR